MALFISESPNLIPCIFSVLTKHSHNFLPWLRSLASSSLQNTLRDWTNLFQTVKEDNTVCLQHLQSYVIPWAGNLMEAKFCVFNTISSIMILISIICWKESKNFLMMVQWSTSLSDDDTLKDALDWVYNTCNWNKFHIYWTYHHWTLNVIHLH